MSAMRRTPVWVERDNFVGWACSECVWGFKPSGPVVGDSIHEMKMRYEQQPEEEFKSHVCAEHPRTTKNPA
jgi:hypothetical protein